MRIRKAEARDIPGVSAVYEGIHTEEEAGRVTIGWARGVYPTADTAKAALARGDLFVAEEDGRIIGTAIINQIQVDAYAGAPWKHSAADDDVMVLHTLVISPEESGKGYGRAFVAFYEQYARENDCPYLRMDTNVKNARARAMYHKLGYDEIGVAPCVFNGIEGVQLVLLEKRLDAAHMSDAPHA